VKPIKLTIKPVDAKKASWFTHPEACLIATALMRQGYPKVGVGDVDVDFYHGYSRIGRFSIPIGLRKFVAKAYGGENYPLERPVVTKQRTFTLKPI
jgi:hypothetical protein